VFSPLVTNGAPTMRSDAAASVASRSGERLVLGSSSLREARIAFESRFIAEQLSARSGNVSRTAEALGISRVMLQKKMKSYGLR
jgi:two-component system nitrogen regulation response regulator NtrX